MEFPSTRLFDRFATWAGPALLTFIALQHLYLAHTTPLSPWRGGGFGMFSVTDVTAMRSWRIDCLDQSGQPCLIHIPQKDEGSPGPRIDLQFRTLPRPAELDKILDFVERRPLVADSRPAFAARIDLGGALARLPADDTLSLRHARAGESGIRVSPIAVKTAAWRLRFDSERLSLTSERLTEPVMRGAC